MTIHDTIITTLAPLIDPFSGQSLEQLGLTIDIIPNNDELLIKLMAGFPVDLLKDTLLLKIHQALSPILPNRMINVTLDTFISPHRTQLPGRGLRGVKNTIAIASGKGGVGKSTVAVNLAAALARAGARVGLLDADIYGPSIPMMLGENRTVEVNEARYVPISAHGLQAMSIGYLTDPDEAIIWRGPMLAKSLLQMLDITAWDDLDYLFIDLPPGTGDIQLSLVQKIPLTAAIVVTTPQNIATLDAQKAIRMFEKTNIDVLGLVENMSLHICSACGHQDAIFGEGGALELSEKFNIPLLGQLPLNSQIRSLADAGSPIALQPNATGQLFMKTALQAAIALAKKPLNYADKFPPIVVE